MLVQDLKILVRNFFIGYFLLRYGRTKNFFAVRAFMTQTLWRDTCDFSKKMFKCSIHLPFRLF